MGVGEGEELRNLNPTLPLIHIKAFNKTIFSSLAKRTTLGNLKKEKLL